jgi:hypothetical protein
MSENLRFSWIRHGRLTTGGSEYLYEATDYPGLRLKVFYPTPRVRGGQTYLFNGREYPSLEAAFDAAKAAQNPTT